VTLQDAQQVRARRSRRYDRPAYSYQSGYSYQPGYSRASIPAEILALGPSCVSLTPQLKRE
jgi:hypothetical protein